MSYTCSVSTLPYCCGFYEAGGFGDEYEYDYYEESLDNLLSSILEAGGGRPISFNFVKYVDTYGRMSDHFEYEAFLEMILKHKNVVDLGMHINPSSKNLIHSLVLKDYK